MFKFRKRSKNESKNKDSEINSSDTLLSFDKIRSKEIGLVIGSIILLPALFLLTWLTSSIFDITPAIFLIAIITPLVVYFLLNPKTKTKSKEFKNTKSSEAYFNNLGYTRAIIRHNYFKQYFRLYTIILVIVITLVVLSFTLSIEESKKTQRDFEDKQLEYEKNREQIAEMKDTEIKDAVVKKINLLQYYELENRNIDLEVQKIIQNNQIIFDDLGYQERSIIWNNATIIVLELSETKMKQNVLDEFENMDIFELRKYLNDENSRTNLYQSFRSVVSLSFSENLLYSIALTPGLFFASLFLIHLITTTKSDYYYQLALGCILTYEKFPDFEQEQKRKHILMSLEFYEQYLKKNFTKSIQQLEEITSAAITNTPQSLDDLSKYLLISLKHPDKFTLLETLPKIINNNNLKIILLHEPLTTRIRELFPILAIIIPVFTTLVLLVK